SLRQRGKYFRSLPNGHDRGGELRRPLDYGPPSAVYSGPGKRNSQEGVGFRRDHDPMPHPLESRAGQDDEEVPDSGREILNGEGKRQAQKGSILGWRVRGQGSARMAGNLSEDHRSF